MKRLDLAWSLCALCLGLVASSSALAARSGGAFQRFIPFHNSLDRTIYPVIQAPQDAPSNAGAGTLNLAYVGISDAPCAARNDDATCGRPLVNLNVPSLK